MYVYTNIKMGFKRCFIIMRKLLYILTILCTVSTCSIVDTSAMSLSKALQSSDLELEFGKGGTIWCNYANESGFPYPGYIKKSEYEYSGNTYFIFNNIIELFTNTKGGRPKYRLSISQYNWSC